MVDQTTQNIHDQQITIPLQSGDRVTLFEDVNVGEDSGFSAAVMFEDRVEKYVAETGLLTFEDADIGQAEFKELLDEAEGVQII